MKTIVVLSALIVAINASADYAAWEQFKLTHNKSYNVKEEQLRFQIFQNNLRKIEEHNARYQNGEVSYYYGVNGFTDMTSEEFKSMLNKGIANKPVLNATLREVDPNKEIPEEVDWTEQAVTPVKAQGSCGSCWAFSTTGALEGQLAIHRGIKEALSAQELIDCSRKNGCGGGSAIDAFKYVEKHGIASERDYPYRGITYSCQNSSRTISLITGYKSVEANENSLKEAISSVGPISVAVHANDYWYMYAGGILDAEQCNGDDLNHQLLAVGYTKSYFILKNSWSNLWGEEGYIRLATGRNQCGVANDASYPIL